MALENTVSNYFLSMLVDCFNVFDCHLSGVIILFKNINLAKLEINDPKTSSKLCNLVLQSRRFNSQANLNTRAGISSAS